MIFLLYLFISVEANVIGIDLGSELIKISIVKPSKKFVIVENGYGKRSTPMSFSINDEGRKFGIDSYNEIVKNPESSLKVVKQLLGRSFTDPFITTILKENYQSPKTEISEYGGVSLIISNKTLEIEGIMGMILENIRDVAYTYGRGPTKDCAISIPSSFTRSQKLSLINSIKYSGLNLLGFIHDNSAAALYYALDRIENDTDHVIVIINVGSSYLQATVIDIWGYYDINGKYINNVNVLGHEHEENLGGNKLNFEISEKIINDFNRKNQVDLKESPKAMARLLREISLAKKALSANTIATIIIEKIINGIDLEYELSRDNLNEIIMSYENKLISPLKRLFTRLKIDTNNINAFELIGGISKIPKIKEIFDKAFAVNFSNHIDPNEAIAHGTAWYAAKDSVMVKVKPIIFTDVSTCNTYAKIDNKKILIFNQTSNLRTTNNIELEVESDKSLTLINECGTDSVEISKYFFEKTEPLSIDFILDSNGLVFLSRALNSNYTSINFTTIEISNPSSPTTLQIAAISEKIASLNNYEQQLSRLAEAKNVIETMAYTLKDKFADEVFQIVTTEEERKKYMDYLNEIITWIESNEFKTVNISSIEQKIEEVNNMTIDAIDREQQYSLREFIIDEAEKYFTKLNDFMVNLTETMTWIPKGETEKVWEEINIAEKWFRDLVDKQKSLNVYDAPVLTSDVLDKKFVSIRQTIENLARFKPKSSNPDD